MWEHASFILMLYESLCDTKKFDDGEREKTFKYESFFRTKFS
jgi:hypothetical protein